MDKPISKRALIIANQALTVVNDDIVQSNRNIVLSNNLAYDHDNPFKYLSNGTIIHEFIEGIRIGRKYIAKNI